MKAQTPLSNRCSIPTVHDRAGGRFVLFHVGARTLYCKQKILIWRCLIQFFQFNCMLKFGMMMALRRRRKSLLVIYGWHCTVVVGTGEP